MREILDGQTARQSQRERESEGRGDGDGDELGKQTTNEKNTDHFRLGCLSCRPRDDWVLVIQSIAPSLSRERIGSLKGEMAHARP